MGRGLSPQQRQILRLAADSRVTIWDQRGRPIEVPGVRFMDTLAALFGARWWIDRPNTAKASLSRSLRRLKERQLMHGWGNDFYLSEAGIQEAQRLTDQDASAGERGVG